MNKEDTKKYLQMLGHQLQEQRVIGQILVADGTVVLLDTRKPKIRRDIDAFLKGDKTAIDIPKDINAHFGGGGAAIREAAAIIAAREGLPADWLRAALKDFFCTQPPHEKWLEYPGLRIFLASTDYVLAMKVAAPDCPQDSEDIKVLAAKLGIANAQGMVACIIKYIPEQLLTAGMQMHIEQCFGQGGNE